MTKRKEALLGALAQIGWNVILTGLVSFIQMLGVGWSVFLLAKSSGSAALSVSIIHGHRF